MQYATFSLGGVASTDTSRGASPTHGESSQYPSASIYELSQQLDRQSLGPRRQTTAFEKPPSQLHLADPPRSRASTTGCGPATQRSHNLTHQHRQRGAPRRKHSSAHLDRMESIVHEMLRGSDGAHHHPPWSPSCSDYSTPSPTFSSSNSSSFSHVSSSSTLAGMQVAEERTAAALPAPSLRKVGSKYKIAKEIRSMASRDALSGGEEMRGLVRKEIRLRKSGGRERLKERKV